MKLRVMMLAMGLFTWAVGNADAQVTCLKWPIDYVDHDNDPNTPDAILYDALYHQNGHADCSGAATVDFILPEYDDNWPATCGSEPGCYGPMAPPDPGNGPPSAVLKAKRNPIRPHVFPVERAESNSRSASSGPRKKFIIFTYRDEDSGEENTILAKLFRYEINLSQQRGEDWQPLLIAYEVTHFPSGQNQNIDVYGAEAVERGNNSGVFLIRPSSGPKILALTTVAHDGK